MEDPFPEGMTLGKLEDTSITVNRQQFTLTRLMAERVQWEINERKAVFEGVQGGSNNPAVIKLRIQMDPRLVERPDDRPIKIQWATSLFDKECAGLQACSGIAGTPTFYVSDVLQQTREYEMPGGYIHVIAMSKVPGAVALGIRDLTQNERSLIKSQFTSILENIRLRGWKFTFPSPEKVLFDRPTGQTYVGGFGGIDEVNEDYNQPITQSSSLVWEFGTNIWRW